MWTRAQLKDKAKAAFRMNYWKTVLVALLVMAIGCAAGAGAGGAGGSATRRYAYDPDASVNVHFDVSAEGAEFEVSQLDDDVEDLVDLEADLDELGPDATPEEIVDAVNGVATEVEEIPVAALVMAGLSFALLMLVAIAIVLAFNAFVINPFEVGNTRFFLSNLNQPAQVREIGYGFDNNYRETVKGMFKRDIFTILWSLLLIVPGIVKAYEYRMIPYLFADDPTMTSDRAFAESRRMMQGNKWRAFVLDLSFLGWIFLSVVTLGLVGIFHAGPYQLMTNAALYETLRYGTNQPQIAATSAAVTMPDEVPVPPFAAEEPEA